MNLKSYLKPLVDKSKGISFYQLECDAATLANISKSYSFGMQFVDHYLKCNHL